MPILARERYISSNELYITLSELARRLRTSTHALKVSRDQGDLPPPVRIGRRWKYSVVALERLFPEIASNGTNAVSSTM